MLRPLLAALLVAAACGGADQPPPGTPVASPIAGTPAAQASPSPAATPAESPGPPKPLFLATTLTDVRTGETFRLDQFGGNVTVVQLMAVW